VHAGGPNILGTMGPGPHSPKLGCGWPLETGSFARVTVPNSVAQDPLPTGLLSLLSHVLALVALGEHPTDAGSRPFKMGCLVLWKHPPSTSVITAKCDRSRSNVAAYYRTLASRLSEWLKVIGTDTDRSATYDFLLVFHSNCEPILYWFWDKRAIITTTTNHPRVFNAKGVPIGIL